MKIFSFKPHPEWSDTYACELCEDNKATATASFNLAKPVVKKICNKCLGRAVSDSFIKEN